MNLNDMPYPEIAERASGDEIREQIQEWILKNADSLTLNQAMCPMTGELFVPCRYTYQEILRTWLKVHARSQQQNNKSAMHLVEKIIEKTIVREMRCGTPLRDSC